MWASLREVGKHHDGEMIVVFTGLFLVYQQAAVCRLELAIQLLWLPMPVPLAILLEWSRR